MSRVSAIELVEVGLRDGLQNESLFLTSEEKIALGEGLIAAGIRRLELGAFVREDRVPQMVGSTEVVDSLLLTHGRKIQGSVLVPNEIGMKKALKTKIKEVAIFASATESFSKNNINCTIEESFTRFKPVLELAKAHKIKVRGYLSVCFGCPYEGAVPWKKVVELAHRLYRMGCYEISIGDTIGVATPGEVEKVFLQLKKKVPMKSLAGHFHNTRGMAIANIFAAYQLGVRVFDASLGGLGGCPYAPGSAGNVATEDVVYLFNGLHVKIGPGPGVDLQRLLEVGRSAREMIGKNLNHPH